ncbi:unnamed protein product [Lampetra fluviatilis]
MRNARLRARARACASSRVYELMRVRVRACATLEKCTHAHRKHVLATHKSGLEKLWVLQIYDKFMGSACA